MGDQDEIDQNEAWPGYLGKGMTSRMFSMPVANMTSRSKPSPKPACWIVPYRLKKSQKKNTTRTKF